MNIAASVKKSGTGAIETADIVRALRSAGVMPGDTIFVQASFAALGAPDADHRLSQSLLDAIGETLGPGGTLVTPGYTFSFCKGEVFDPDLTPSAMGPWSPANDFLELVRAQPGALRSRDPIHSVVCLGPGSETLLANLPPTCFGAGSIHDRLYRLGAKLCMIGVGLREATFRHFVEEVAGVPFRYRKLFSGYVREGGRMAKLGWVYNVRILAEAGYPEGERLERLAREQGVSNVAQLGDGEVEVAHCGEFYELTKDALSRDAWFTARGPAGDPAQLERDRVSIREPEVVLPPNASAGQMLEALWRLPRSLVNDAYDAALAALAKQVPMTVHGYPSGAECWSWIIPEKWTCHEARLETLDGKTLFSYESNPLHVVSYSLPFEGVVSRDELDAHLHTHSKLPDAIPFQFKYYERDWGLCCSRNLRETLTDDRYRVVIRTEFSYGTLKVGEIVIPGTSEETIVLCAHLCHPAMANDDLSGVIVAVLTARELLKRPPGHFTYRVIIVPETIGTVAYLSSHEDLIPRMRGGLFLEMLGLGNPHALQRSFAGNTQTDQCFELALKEQDPAAWAGAYRTVIGNDERQFNGPGVRVPMLSLSRVLPPDSPDWPYPEYHSSWDDLLVCSAARLEESAAVTLRMLDSLERNWKPVNLFKGEAFCSRYGLHIDWQVNPEGSRALFHIMDRIDGSHTVADIARECGVPFSAVVETLKEMERCGLISLAR